MYHLRVEVLELQKHRVLLIFAEVLLRREEEMLVFFLNPA
jgi:hypothetical protein